MACFRLLHDDDDDDEALLAEPAVVQLQLPSSKSWKGSTNNHITTPSYQHYSPHTSEVLIAVYRITGMQIQSKNLSWFVCCSIVWCQPGASFGISRWCGRNKNSSNCSIIFDNWSFNYSNRLIDHNRWCRTTPLATSKWNHRIFNSSDSFFVCAVCGLKLIFVYV